MLEPTTPFGQSSNGPFGSRSGFGQNKNASSNLFTSNPFGSSTPFSPSTGGSVFGGTSTGLFGVNSLPGQFQQSISGSPSPPALGTLTAVFSAHSAPAFGTSSSSSGAFGQSCSMVSGTSSVFGQNGNGSSNPFTSNPFGSTSTFGTPREGSVSGGTSMGLFGLNSSSLGQQSTYGSPSPLCCGNSTAAFDATLAPAFGTSSGALRNPAFDASTTTRFSFVSANPAVGLSNSATGSSTAGIQSSSGGQSTTSTFSFGHQQRGSRLASYTATALTEEAKDRNGRLYTQQLQLQSISGMHINKVKNHEELRWEDYQSGNKGMLSHEELRWEDYQSGNKGGIGDLHPYTFTSLPLNTSPSVSSVMTTAPLMSPLSWNPASASGFNSGLISSNTQPSPVFPSTVPPVGFSSGMSSANPEPSLVFQSVAPLPCISPFQSPVVSQPNVVRGSPHPPLSNPPVLSQTTPFLTTPSHPTQTTQTGAFANSEFPPSSAGLHGFTATTGVLGQSTCGLPFCTQKGEEVQPVPCVSPWGALPSLPQLSIGQLGSMLPTRYGISSMPVVDKPAPALRVSSLLTSRHLSHRRIKLPARKYDPKSDGQKVPFFNDSKELPTAAKGGAAFSRRENPRNLVVLPAEQWRQRSDTKIMSQVVHASLYVYKSAHLVENMNSNHEHKEHVTDVEASMPRLSRSDYYTEPQLPELAANERAEPGFCCHVKNFVVGRHGYGSIKFLGETNVRHLDLDSHVKFNNREVMVYMDEKEKPPVGEGLNKAAEVTLLNVKCIDKMGNRYIYGPKVNKYREMLIKKAKDQGAEFVSYDPMEGEWKFRVHHFSQYRF